jgi:cation-transporting P-type ATPase E
MACVAIPLSVGLTTAEVAARIAAGKVNRPPRSGTKNIGTIVFKNLFSLFNLIIGCILFFFLVFYAFTQDTRLLLDCVGVSCVTLFNTVIALIQEIRAKLAMDKLNMLVMREVAVIRDGVLVNIPHHAIVLGDCIAIRRGDQAVVDGTVLQSNYMEMDESLLTGESAAVDKEPGDKILSGSFCLSGNAYYVVEALSDGSYASQVTQIAQRLKPSVSPLQARINQIVKLLFVAAVILCVVQLAAGALQHQLNIDFVRKLGAILIGLVPQGLVLTISLIFATGILRISSIGAVVQTFNAIDSFANVDIICMDKTGTLTQDRMSVRAVTPLTDGAVETTLKTLLGTYARLSSDDNSTIRALQEFEAHPSAKAVEEYPFNSRRKMSILRVNQDGKEIAYVLGACEILLSQCDASARLRCANAIAAGRIEVYRNLLFGCVIDPEKIERRPDDLGAFQIQPLCLVSLSDMVRPDAAEVIREFGRIGIKFKILSGDSGPAVLATCRDINWEIPHDAMITGGDLDKLSAPAFEAAVFRCTVFARLRPEQKIKIVDALRARGLRITMIGDGVNDVPALKQADLGIAMDDGAAITKEVSDIILKKNCFYLLPEIFGEGHTMINTAGAVARVFLTKNIMVIYLTLASVLLFLDFPLTPRRVSLINIFAIGLPSMAVVVGEFPKTVGNLFISLGRALRRMSERIFSARLETSKGDAGCAPRLPTSIVALAASNATKEKGFVLNLVSFVCISALVIVAAGYVGFHISGQPGAETDSSRMAMVSIMIGVSFANFLLVAWGGHRLKNMIYVGLVFIMLVGYYGVASAQGNGAVVSAAKKIYEVYTINGDLWWIIAGVCGVSWLVLMFAQKVRSVLTVAARSRRASRQRHAPESVHWSAIS